MLSAPASVLLTLRPSRSQKRVRVVDAQLSAPLPKRRDDMPCFETCLEEMYKTANPCHEALRSCTEPAFDRYHGCLQNCPLIETVYESQDKRDRES